MDVSEFPNYDNCRKQLQSLAERSAPLLKKHKEDYVAFDEERYNMIKVVYLYQAPYTSTKGVEEDEASYKHLHPVEVYVADLKDVNKAVQFARKKLAQDKAMLMVLNDETAKKCWTSSKELISSTTKDGLLGEIDNLLERYIFRRMRNVVESLQTIEQKLMQGYIYNIRPIAPRTKRLKL